MAARDKPLSVKFVATEGLVWQGEVVSVLVRTTEGDIGIWSGHEPFMAALVPHGAEIVTDDGARHIIAVDSGFISVFDNHVSVLSAFGELAEEISLDDARIQLAAMHDRVQLAKADDSEVRTNRRLLAQVRAGEKQTQLSRRPTGS